MPAGHLLHRELVAGAGRAYSVADGAALVEPAWGVL